MVDKDNNQNDDLSKNIPYSFDERNNVVRWVRLCDRGFVQPFFHDTIRESMRLTKTWQTGLEHLLDAPVADSVTPAVFIFHVSRCGSTLLTQMLAQSARNIVLSEPTLLNDLLLSHLPLSVKKRALVKALEIFGRKRNNLEDYLIIKTDSWHLLYFDLIRELFPHVPVVFLTREPLGILMSHKRYRGCQMVPGLLKIQIVEQVVPAYDLDAYAAKVLHRFYTIMNEKWKEADLLLDYRQHAEMLVLFLKKTALTFSQDEIEKMLARASRHSKDPLAPVLLSQPVDHQDEMKELAHLSGLFALYNEFTDKMATEATKGLYVR